jgi:hypothetical protein
MKSPLPRICRLLPTPTALTWHAVPAAWAVAVSVAFYLTALLVTSGITVRILAAQDDSQDKSSLMSLPPSASLTAEEQKKEAEFPYVIPCEFQPTVENFAAGDNISITAVRGNRQHIEPGGTLLVVGTYQLHSAAKATLLLNLPKNTATQTRGIAWQSIDVTHGTGDFALQLNRSDDGRYRVSFFFPHDPGRDGRSGTNSGGGVYLSEVLSLAEEEAEFLYVVPCEFKASVDDILSSDRINITDVRENRKQILVKGTYRLDSAPKATLTLVGGNPATTRQIIAVARGTGHFALRANLSGSGTGNFRVSFYGPRVLGSVYIIER